MTPTFEEKIATVLREYGQAIRGDWSMLDGRCVRDQLDRFAGWIWAPQDAPSIEEMRDWMGVCPFGGAHWDDQDHFGICAEEES